MNTRNLFSRKLTKKTPPLPYNFTSLIKVSGSETCLISDSSPFCGNLSSCIASLQSCALHQNLVNGKEIHSWMIVNEFLKSPFSVTSLINMYSKCNRPDDALAIFDGARGARSLFAWNAIISGLVNNGLPRDAVEMYRKMRGENVAPDKFTFPCVIKACSDVNELREAEKIHAQLLKIGFESDAFIASALISFYLKFEFTEEAGRVFDELTERDVVLWNAMINGYAGIGKFDLALEIFERMGEEGIALSKFTVTGILSVFTEIEDLSNGRKIHGYVMKIGYGSDLVISNSLIDMYGKCKCLEDAREIFETMPQKDIFSWNSIISVCEQTGDHDGTLGLFDRMRGARVRPDSVTISAILPACSHMAALMHGREIHGYMIINGLRTKDGDGDDVYVHNAIMDMYAKCGSLRDARLVFDRMVDRDAASWNIMIMGYGMHGHGHDALDMFSNMCSARVKPDEVTFVGVLSACSHSGLVEPGQEILTCMESDHGVIPTIEHYACAVDMLGRAGQLNEAYELALAMPVEPNPVVWRAFLAACRLHGSAALAEIAAKRLFELDPGHCGSYVLLSNIYGAVGRYEDVLEVRATMRVRNVKKRPGCSWIELNTIVHVFVTGDRAHSESEQIYAILHVLIGRLREFGYVPDLRHVLQCVD